MSKWPKKRHFKESSAAYLTFEDIGYNRGVDDCTTALKTILDELPGEWKHQRNCRLNLVIPSYICDCGAIGANTMRSQIIREIKEKAGIE